MERFHACLCWTGWSAMLGELRLYFCSSNQSVWQHASSNITMHTGPKQLVGSETLFLLQLLLLGGTHVSGWSWAVRVILRNVACISWHSWDRCETHPCDINLERPKRHPPNLSRKPLKQVFDVSSFSNYLHCHGYHSLDSTGFVESLMDTCSYVAYWLKVGAWTISVVGSNHRRNVSCSVDLANKITDKNVCWWKVFWFYQSWRRH